MKEILYILVLVFLLYYFRTYKTISIIDMVVLSSGLVVLFMLYFMKKNVEKFSEDKFIEIFKYPDYKEPLLKQKNFDKDLVYYISTFNKDYVQFNTDNIDYLLNIIDNNIGAVTLQNMKDIFDQVDGINVHSRLIGPSASRLFNNIDKFSILFYMKLNSTKEVSTSLNNGKKYNLLKMFCKNVKDANELLSINVVYKENSLNPNIVISMLEKDRLIYEYSDKDFEEGKIFNDGNYHLFTLIKNNSELKLYMDNKLLAQCVGENCFDIADVKLLDHKHDIEISEDNLFLNYDLTNKLKFDLNAFGVYTTDIDEEKVMQLSKYYKSIKKELDPTYQSVISEHDLLKKKLKNYEKCPFSNRNICSSYECKNINDWTDLNNIFEKNENCFKKTVEHCNEVKDYTNDKLCSFLSQKNIFKMASTLDSNLFYYNPNNTDGNISNERVLKELRKLGLKDIYLDKSVRTDGTQNSEMNRLIQELLKTNQTVDIDTIDSLYNPTAITNPIDYNTLGDNMSKNESTISSEDLLKQLNLDKAKVDIPDMIQSSESNIVINNKNLDTNLVNLKFDDLSQPDVYDSVMKKYNEEKVNKKKSNWEFWNLFS
jgi:hypothetical protein